MHWKAHSASSIPYSLQKHEARRGKETIAESMKIQGGRGRIFASDFCFRTSLSFVEEMETSRHGPRADDKGARVALLNLYVQV